MGNKTSKNSKETLATTYTRELKSYEAACKEDTELQSFDTCLKTRTSQVISSLSTGVDVKALTLSSLKDLTECLLEMNQEVGKVILNSKENLWKHKQLLELVNDYMETSLNTLDFYAALKKCLDQAGVSHLSITLALHHFEDESLIQGGNGYKKTLKELKNFKDMESPFNEDFYKMFQSVYKQQILMLEKLQLHKKKLGKKLKRIHTWRKISAVIFAATFATMLICSIVTAAMAAPPVAASLAAASAVSLGAVGRWIDSLWKNYEKEVKGKKEVISSMQAGTFVAVKDLDNIRDMIEQLETEIKGMTKSAEIAVEHGELKIGMDEIKKKLEGFHKNVEKLGNQADLCCRDIVKARTVVLQRLLKQID